MVTRPPCHVTNMKAKTIDIAAAITNAGVAFGNGNGSDDFTNSEFLRSSFSASQHVIDATNATPENTQKSHSDENP